MLEFVHPGPRDLCVRPRYILMRVIKISLVKVMSELNRM
jgi:hypothetical protein